MEGFNPAFPGSTITTTSEMPAAHGKLMVVGTDPVIGYTPLEVLNEEYTTSIGGFKADDTYTRSPVREMLNSTEGDVHFKRSSTSGKCFVVKHTKMGNNRNSFTIPNEVRIARQMMPHQNIVAALYCEPDDVDHSRHFVYSEFCEGGDLWDQMHWCWDELDQPMPEVCFLHVAVELFGAFAFLHSGLRYVGGGRYTKDEHHVAVVHGDIKPENIFLRWSPRDEGGLPNVVVGDFGASKFVTDGADLQTGCGTQMYHAPEDKELYDLWLENSHNKSVFYAIGQRKVTASDIYAVGLVLHQLAQQQYDAITIGTPTRFVSFSHGYGTNGINETILRCLEVPVRWRATANFDAQTGVLVLINELRNARDQLIRDGPALSATEFGNPRPQASLICFQASGNTDLTDTGAAGP